MKGRALLIDDDAQVARIGRLTLRALGYSVDERRCPEDAIAALNADADAYDFVITDHTMPRMTGLEVATHVKAIRADLPVILCTGYLGMLTPEEVARAGVKEILQKPYSRDELAQILARVVV